MHDQAPANPGSTHRYTPGLSVCDSLGRSVRQVAYWRDTAQRSVERRVTLSRYDPSGQRSRQWDPRLFQRLDEDDSVPPCQTGLTSLSGRPLLQESADAGWQLVLFAEAGQPLERWDSRNSHWQTGYDTRMRPLLIRETLAGQPTRVAERFSYGGVDAVAGNHCGRLLRHDDEGGSRLTSGYSLNGEEQGETRHFLTDLDLPDWPAAPEERDALLEPGDGASTQVIHSPLGEALEQTDALGNCQRSGLTVAGELATVTLHCADGSEHRLLSDSRYNAFGQVETQTAGNGVIRLALYDPANGRLLRLSASRPGHSSLQDLLYSCDPAGNVLRIEDLSQPVSHFANQRVEPVSTFVYDSLYQLIEASGREAAGTLPGPDLPALVPDPEDASRLLNYRQHFEYDANGNLLSLRHVGQQPWTRRMGVAQDSNHALPWTGDVAPDNPRAGFDGNGNLVHLQSGRPLLWNARNQLHGLQQVRRENGENDEEHYRYGGDGLRIRKVTTRLVAGRLQRSDVRYLPGLELRDRAGERLGVASVQAGGVAVRCLQWREGPPDGIDNPQLRYSLDDHLGSSTLELDGEARLISHEGYYPFGGTAWWAARSALEAGYKTRRYSGKERDASGLYAYGLRYYAPWLARWINPDPAGDVDGLNRFAFVGNNPGSTIDPNGLNKVEVQRFPLEDRVPAPPSMQSRVSHARSARLTYTNPKNSTFELAYDVAWTAKSLLFRGAGNQVGDVLDSGMISMAYTSKLRRLLDADYTAKRVVEHALAAGTGNCDEYGQTCAYLAASSARWDGSPVQLAQIPGHTFAVLGDHRIGGPVVMDAWVAYPIPHPLAYSKYSMRKLDFFDRTPRMPQDPTYEISQENVDMLSLLDYADGSETGRYPSLVDSVKGDMQSGHTTSRWLWFQNSAMHQSQDVWYMDMAGNYTNGALVPAAHAERMQRSLSHANDFIRAHPGLRFKHL